MNEPGGNGLVGVHGHRARTGTGTSSGPTGKRKAVGGSCCDADPPAVGEFIETGRRDAAAIQGVNRGPQREVFDDDLLEVGGNILAGIHQHRAASCPRAIAGEPGECVAGGGLDGDGDPVSVLVACGPSWGHTSASRRFYGDGERIPLNLERDGGILVAVDG